LTKLGAIDVTVFRFDPDVDDMPRYEHHEVPRRPHMRVLDVLEFLYQEAGEALAYRWYCGTKKCGECGISVNGKPMLGCWEAAVDDMVLEPLGNFPIVRDLVVDTDDYEQVILKAKPFMKRAREPRFPEKLPAETMDGAHRLSKCIECNVCTAATPVKSFDRDGVDWDGYGGAAALVRFARFVLDVRDQTERMNLAQVVGLPTFPLYYELDGICPQGIDIVREALVPANRRLFDNDGPEPSGKPVRCFVRGPRWCGFVTARDSDLAAMRMHGMLEPTDVAGIEHSYVMKP
tara:strand:- start:1296 stop:2165 length:870 start_codon:yes stop_codon:yes gene_type:complete